MQLPAAKLLYQKYMQEKGYATSTIEKRGHLLNLFLNYLLSEKIKKIEEISKKHLEQYLKARYYHLNHKEKQNKPESRNNEIEAIKQFFKFLNQKNYLKHDLAEEISYVKEPKLQIPKDIMSKNELRKILKQPDLQTSLGYRDRLCLELLYATGMRRSELIGLDVGDINLKEKMILIRQGKGQKDRNVPINNTAFNYLKNYLEEIRPKLILKNPEKALILSENGNRLNGSSLRIRLKKYSQKARLKKEITLHSFRHTFATHLIQKGMPIRHVQELLGHEQLDTTTRYLNLTIKDLQKEYKKTHPRELVG